MADLKRVLHTLKGGARLAGVPQIGDLSHAFESMLDDMPGGEVPQETCLDLARQASDRLMEQGDQLASGREVQAFSDLVARLESPAEVAPQEARPSEAAGIGGCGVRRWPHPYPRPGARPLRAYFRRRAAQDDERVSDQSSL